MPGHVWTENWSTKTSLITSTHRIILIPFSNSTPPGCCFGTLSCRRIATRDIRGEPRGEWRGEWRGEPLPTRLRAPETAFDVTWCDMMSKFKSEMETSVKKICKFGVETLRSNQAPWHWKISDASLTISFQRCTNESRSMFVLTVCQISCHTNFPLLLCAPVKRKNPWFRFGPCGSCHIR